MRQVLLPLVIAALAAAPASATPPVQVLVPGFAVREIPVDLPNINCLRYRPDGKLLALCYDGSVWTLSDTDGDGLEDRAEQFWKNDGTLQSPLAMVVVPEGLYVSAHQRVMLLRNDGRAETIATDWAAAARFTGKNSVSAGVDALGLARDRDGNLYVAIGTPDFTNAYLLTDGKPSYDIGGERGAILKISADRSRREVHATGVRFGVSLAFNAEGDLFCTDQEGATWLPNGNPLDELLHVEAGRHYGFPPRHPAHLPGVIDEPSVFDYAPQHQSTCGLTFIEPVGEGAAFGPTQWRSDAIVAGYSRGKLFRTSLVKTSAGYVAKNQLLATLAMLTVDTCVAPDGGLVVACHSGKPDWGSGPSGTGKLYKILYSEPTLAVPVLAWPQSATELRIAFDKPLTDLQLAELGVGAHIEYGRYVAAGDRFETLWPGYKVVQDQKRSTRNVLKVQRVSASPDHRQLIVTTAAHVEAVPHAVTLPGLGRPTKPVDAQTPLWQLPETDLQYDLTGVEAAWEADDANDRWSGWLPHADLEVAKHFSRQSDAHDELWQRLKRPGKLTIKTALDTRDMLRPAVQPGSQLDYALPAEIALLNLRSQTPFVVRFESTIEAYQCPPDHSYSAETKLPIGRRVPVEIILKTGKREPNLQMSWSTAEDARPRPWPLRRLFVPWAPDEKPLSSPGANADLPELAGGNWERGRKIFFGDQANCSKCHTWGFEGGAIGPDLSNLSQRDYASVLRDVTEPNDAVNPDYVTQRFTLKDGRVLTGSARLEGDRLLIGDEKGQVTAVARAEVEDCDPSRQSIMPSGIPALLGPEKLRDLLTFLLSEPASMPTYAVEPRAPRPRPYREIAALVAGSVAVSEPRPLRIVLVSGKKDHGLGEHDYPAWKSAWASLLKLAEQTAVETADAWLTPEQLQRADVLVFYQKGAWTPQKARDMDAFFARGGGAVYIHYAVDGGKDAPDFAQRIGLAWQGKHSKFRHGPLELGFEGGSQHPIARNFEKLKLLDESYWNLIGDATRLDLLASGIEENERQPLFWTLEPANGRVVVSIPGHYSWTFDDPAFRLLLLRSIAWAAREPIDRFNALVTPGARVSK